MDLHTDDIAGYNALMPEVNQEVDEYNSDVMEYNQLSRDLMGTKTSCSHHPIKRDTIVAIPEIAII